MCLAYICFFQNASHNALHSTFSFESFLFWTGQPHRAVGRIIHASSSMTGVYLVFSLLLRWSLIYLDGNTAFSAWFKPLSYCVVCKPQSSKKIINLRWHWDDCFFVLKSCCFLASCPHSYSQTIFASVPSSGLAAFPCFSLPQAPCPG